MSFKVSSIVSNVANSLGKITKAVSSNATDEISKTSSKVASEVQKAVSEPVDSKIAVSYADALKARVLADYQYPKDGHLLGATPEDREIHWQLRYCGDLADARQKIKEKTIYKSADFRDGYLKELCDKFGEDRVISEINARLNGCYWEGDLGPWLSQAHISAECIIKAHGWDYRYVDGCYKIIDK